MAVSPVPDHPVARDAADRIIERRTRAGDPHLEQLGDGLEEVVAHVARRPAGNLRDLLDVDDPLERDVVRADVVDALLVLDYLADRYARQVARWRLGVIQAGRRAGMGPTALMAPLHQRHRQGVGEMVERLRAFLDRRVEGASVGAARQVAADDRADRALAAAAGDPLREFAEALVGEADHTPADLAEEAGQDCDDLAEALDLPASDFLPTLRVIVRYLEAERARLRPPVRAVLDTYAHLLPVLRIRPPAARVTDSAAGRG
jgi:hypothetical protein